jgi:uncharacterized repeat protein (TIGR03809 family)
MPTDPAKPFADLALRWHALAERRLDYYTELYRSGRWQHYYATQQEFAARVLEVIRTVKIWAELAGRRPAARVQAASTDRKDLRSAA